MLYTLLAVVLILWLLGFSVAGIGPLAHLLLVVAAIILVVNFLSGRRQP